MPSPATEMISGGSSKTATVTAAVTAMPRPPSRLTKMIAAGKTR
ncbi:MAG TPA: hypothetical protein VGG16_30095 [Streptosporangiaceae bacterium]